MKIYVVSRGHVPRMHFLKWYPFHSEVTVVTHHKDNLRDIHKAFPRVNIVATGMDGVVSSRNFICQELVPLNEWYVGIDDDIEGYQITCPAVWNMPSVDQYTPPPQPYATWRAAYRVPLQPAQLLKAYSILRARCIRNGTIYGSFASQENPFFRARKWSDVKFAKSGSHVMRNTREILWDGEYGHDTHYSVETVVRYGCVAVCNYIYPLHKMYGAGGLGPIAARRPVLDKQLNAIVAKYPGLVKIAKGKNSALRFVRTSKQSVITWRATLEGHNV